VQAVDQVNRTSICFSHAKADLMRACETDRLKFILDTSLEVLARDKRIEVAQLQLLYVGYHDKKDSFVELKNGSVAGVTLPMAHPNPNPSHDPNPDPKQVTPKGYHPIAHGSACTLHLLCALSLLPGMTSVRDRYGSKGPRKSCS
jgi:hypothetical protein